MHNPESNTFSNFAPQVPHLPYLFLALVWRCIFLTLLQ